MFVGPGNERLSPRRGEMWPRAPFELFDRTYDRSGVGAVGGCILQTLNPSGVRELHVRIAPGLNTRPTAY